MTFVVYASYGFGPFYYSFAGTIHMRLNLTYHDMRNKLSEMIQIIPDATGTYQLPLLADHSPAHLRLMPVNDGSSPLALHQRTFFLPDSGKSMLNLHVPVSWKQPSVTVILAATSAVPKHLLFVVATPELADAEAILHSLGTDATMPFLLGMLTHMAHYPNLPFRDTLKAVA